MPHTEGLSNWNCPQGGCFSVRFCLMFFVTVCFQTCLTSLHHGNGAMLTISLHTLSPRHTIFSSSKFIFLCLAADCGLLIPRIKAESFTLIPEPEAATKTIYFGGVSVPLCDSTSTSRTILHSPRVTLAQRIHPFVQDPFGSATEALRNHSNGLVNNTSGLSIPVARNDLRNLIHSVIDYLSPA
ncbi:hypothetical protein GWK47_044540 [Chionoecetes opilio]|uniref:Uncharacterized protein n=1 Tax=Chionoecetes opilio TaxID=41210 RepID=A0A8J5CV88_CHIOP|nr:hypothetical protein GWK47_044540 [Chionoecetes opilio]